MPAQIVQRTCGPSTLHALEDDAHLTTPKAHTVPDSPMIAAGASTKPQPTTIAPLPHVARTPQAHPQLHRRWRETASHDALRPTTLHPLRTTSRIHGTLLSRIEPSTSLQPNHSTSPASKHSTVVISWLFKALASQSTSSPHSGNDRKESDPLHRPRTMVATEARRL